MPRYTEVEWSKAACASIGSVDVFYSFEESRAVKKLMNIDVFRNICAPCPIWRNCLRYALEHEVYGVWGGLTGDERQALRMGRFNAQVAQIMTDFEYRGISPEEFIEIVSEYEENYRKGTSPTMLARKRQLQRYTETA
jgi:WhiB family transcriptional regulator, redox-sensing transcriptional regulator